MRGQKRSGPDDRSGDRGPGTVEQLPGRLDAETTGLRRGVQAISTPREAVEAMVAAGAVFAVQRRSDSLGLSFTYSMQPGGDIKRAREILAMVKERPPVFLQAFRAFVQQAAGPIN